MIKSAQAKDEFKAVVKGENFMTPDVISYYFAGDYAVELSRGTGFSGNRLYGVTVVNAESQKCEYDLSKCFKTIQEAKQHIKELSK